MPLWRGYWDGRAVACGVASAAKGAAPVPLEAAWEQ